MAHQATSLLDRKVEQQRFHQCWYPVALSQDIVATKPVGIDLLGTRIVAYRNPQHAVIVQEAWCPHLGADLSLGECAQGTVRCPYHHWRFDGLGRCVDIPTGDKIPPGATIFTFPAGEAWGLVWVFNGVQPTCEAPGIPDVGENELSYSAHARGSRKGQPWIATSNGVDFQHLRTLHHLQAGAPEDIVVGDHGIEYCIDTPYFMQHGRISGTNVFSQHLRIGDLHQFMLFAGAPIDSHCSRGFYVVGVKRGQPAAGGDHAAEAQLVGLRSFVERLIAEDAPVLNSINFRRGVLTASDRHLSRYFKYVSEFPLAPERP